MTAQNARRARWEIAGLPAYEYIALDLRQQIESGRLRPNARLPSAPKLQEKYAVSQTTIRNAITALRNQGLVMTANGSGVYVRPAGGDPRQSSARRIEVLDNVLYDPDLDDPALDELHRADGKAAPPQQVALLMDLPPGAEVIHVSRILRNSISGRRLVHQLYVPLDLVPRPRTPMPVGGEFYQFLRTTDQRPQWTEAVAARLPTPEEDRALAVPRSTPVLLTHRLTINNHGLALALEETLRSADDIRFVYALPTGRGS
ncbi:GntR family transcriptional regulator [Kribbella koreensis]|uniref:GntR family transcriptional regulator n=1 Tax=Kribbella koreensis TaxID=57909 RepID=A0ABP4BAT6_9ACTN